MSAQASRPRLTVFAGALAGSVLLTIAVAAIVPGTSPPGVADPSASLRPSTTAAPFVTTEPSPSPAVGQEYFADPEGSDEHPGTEEKPFGTVEHAIGVLRAGDILYLRGGDYVEDVDVEPAAGTVDAPIVVMSYPGERAVIHGLVRIEAPTHLVLDGFNVTWNHGDYDEHMVRINGGESWTLRNSEIWGAESFAGLLISGSPIDWTIQDNAIHDTHGGESDPNRSHNVYANTGLDAENGLIERNLLFNAEHGSNLKLAGPNQGPDFGAADIVVRYNTLYNATQPLLIGDGSRDLTIEYNLVGGGHRGNAVRLYKLTGDNVVLRNNIGVHSDVWCDDYESEAKCEDVDAGGNKFPVDPDFDSRDVEGFRPQAPDAAAYGRYGQSD